MFLLFRPRVFSGSQLGARVCATVQVWALAEVRGTRSGGSKSRKLASNDRVAFRWGRAMLTVENPHFSFLFPLFSTLLGSHSATVQYSLHAFPYFCVCVCVRGCVHVCAGTWKSFLGHGFLRWYGLVNVNTVWCSYLYLSGHCISVQWYAASVEALTASLSTSGCAQLLSLAGTRQRHHYHYHHHHHH